MCLAIPGILRSKTGTDGVVDYGGLHKKADLTLTPAARIGDCVIVHAGFAIAILDQKEAEKQLKLAAEVGLYG